jgi:hypothetical protein
MGTGAEDRDRSNEGEQGTWRKRRRRKRGQVKLRDIRPTFDLALSWELESPSFYSREEANGRVEPVTIRGKDRIDARIDEKTRSSEERRRKAHGAGQARALAPSHGGKRCSIPRLLESFGCVPLCAQELGNGKWGQVILMAVRPRFDLSLSLTRARLLILATQKRLPFPSAR